MSRQGDGSERQGRLMGAPVHRLEDVDLLRETPASSAT